MWVKIRILRNLLQDIGVVFLYFSWYARQENSFCAKAQNDTELPCSEEEKLRFSSSLAALFG